MWTAGLASRKRKDRDTFYKASVEEDCSNRVLAGYLAHEFLSKGTLLGQRFDPARAKEEQSVQESYAEVATILKAYGTHIAGVINPTELVRWINK